MLRRVPHLIMGVLTVLSIGAIILGLAQAPRTPDLQLHNAFSLTFATTSFVGQAKEVYTTPGQRPQVDTVRFSYLKPDTVNVTNTATGATQRFTGEQAKVFLASFVVLDPDNGWIAKGSTYTLSLPAYEALQPTASASTVRGTASATVVLAGKYVHTFHEHVSYTYQGVRRLFDGYLRFVSIDGAPVSG